jgi:hypothetical protein
MRQRRILRATSVTVLAFALACAPMAVASAHAKKHHRAAKHHTTKTAVAKAGLNPGSKLCAEAVAGESNSGNLGSSVEKAMIAAETSGNFAAAKAAMLAQVNASLKEEGPALAALRSAPANVQAAMKGLFTYVQSFETAINSAQSFPQFATSMESLITTSNIEADATTLSDYLSVQCGVTTTTTTLPIGAP